VLSSHLLISEVTGTLPINCPHGKTEDNAETVPAWRRSLIGQSPAMRQLCEVIKLIAPKRITVLISGETGTGKEVVARAIHAASLRSSNAMVAVNCTALPSSLVESELFGHVKGAFTGAHNDRAGRFEQAHRGTIFLDEVGDLPLEAQAKILRVLQEQEFERLGSSETIRVDVRVIAASNVELDKAVRERRFREDLFYRLNVVPLHIPALRERREDIPCLVQCLLERTRLAESAAPKNISDEALNFLMEQDWPGNVRQLEHTVQMACALSGDRYLLGPQDFVLRGRERSNLHAPAYGNDSHAFTLGPEGLDFELAVGRFERSLLKQALALSGGNKARAADLLRIKRTTLLAKIKAFEERTALDCLAR
jgi:transcriptional regulator with GAF, ATPase, and Fis domain